MQFFKKPRPADLSVNRTISERDAMFISTPDEETYLKAGKSVANTVRVALEFAGLSPKSILDYGCGHGRVLRWFQSFWPNANLTAADVATDQIEFCAQTFGANPFLIDKPFDEVRLPSSYDLIWLGSIFTHVDSTGWGSLTDSMIKHTRPNGLLCFSFAGRHVYELLKSGDRFRINDKREPDVLKAIGDYESFGFGFFGLRESQGQTWGRAIVSPEWVLHSYSERAGKVVLFSEQAYGGRQDIVCIQFPDRQPQ